MRIIAKKALVDFYTLYPDAKLSLEDWYRKTIDAQWTCFADIKKFSTILSNFYNYVLRISLQQSQPKAKTRS